MQHMIYVPNSAHDLFSNSRQFKLMRAFCFYGVFGMPRDGTSNISWCARQEESYSMVFLMGGEATCGMSHGTSCMHLNVIQG